MQLSVLLPFNNALRQKKAEAFESLFSTKASSSKIQDYPEWEGLTPEKYSSHDSHSQSILQSSTMGSPVQNPLPGRNLARLKMDDDSLFKVPEPRGSPALRKVSNNSSLILTNDVRKSDRGILPVSKRRLVDSDDSDEDFQFVKKVKKSNSKSDDDRSDKKANSKSLKNKKRKKNLFLLTQADVSGTDSSEEDCNADEEVLDDSFIDDEAASQQNDTDQHALYLRSIKDHAGLGQNYKLKYLGPQHENGTMESIYNDTNYEFDSFCVGDNDIEYLSSNSDDKTPQRKRVGVKKFRRIRTIDSSSSNDETSPRKSFKPIDGAKKFLSEDSGSSKNLPPTVRKSSNVEKPLESSSNKGTEKCNRREYPSSKLARKIKPSEASAVDRNIGVPWNAASRNRIPDHDRKSNLQSSDFDDLAEENDIEIVYESSQNKNYKNDVSSQHSSLQNKNGVQKSGRSNENHFIPPEFADEVMSFDLENLDENVFAFEDAESFDAGKSKHEKREVSKDKSTAKTTKKDTCENVDHNEADVAMCFDSENRHKKKNGSKDNISVKSAEVAAFSDNLFHKDSDEIMCFDLENFHENMLEFEDTESFATVKSNPKKREISNDTEVTESNTFLKDVLYKDNRDVKEKDSNSVCENLQEFSFDMGWDEPVSFCFGTEEVADAAVASTSTAAAKSNSKIIPILVDSRELASGKPVISLLRNKYGINPVVMHLTSADYVLSSRLAVERILDSEFSSLQMPPRIVEKIKIMQEMYEKTAIIVEKDNRKQRLSFSKNDTKYLSFSLNVCWHDNMNILCSDSPEHTAQLLFGLVQKEQKRNLHISVPTAINARNQDLYNFYCSFPLVSPICALNFMYNFPILKMFFESSAHEIKKGGLISSRRASKIFNYLRSQYFQIDS